MTNIYSSIIQVIPNASKHFLHAHKFERQFFFYFQYNFDFMCCLCDMIT